jgi:chromosome segregation ATPase
VRNRTELEGKLLQMTESETQKGPKISPEEVQLLNEQISSLQKSLVEVRSQLEAESSEKDSLSTRAQYLEEMLESVSQTNMNSSSETLRAMESELSRAQQEILHLRTELEIRQKIPPLHTQPSGLHPVYDIFGLPENFEATPTETPRRSIDITNFPSAEKEPPKQDESQSRKSSGPTSGDGPHRQRETSIRLPPTEVSSDVVRNQPPQGLQSSDQTSSTSSLLSQQSMRVKSSVSDLAVDPRALRSQRNTLQTSIAKIRMDRQNLKKEILDWQAKFEQENGREATREERLSLASELMDQYHDVSSTH